MGLPKVGLNLSVNSDSLPGEFVPSVICAFAPSSIKGYFFPQWVLGLGIGLLKVGFNLPVN